MNSAFSHASPFFREGKDRLSYLNQLLPNHILKTCANKSSLGKIIRYLNYLEKCQDMTSADKFGVIFSIAFAAAMIALMGGLLQADTAPAAPSVAAPAQT